jgi:hypothetical protein
MNTTTDPIRAYLATIGAKGGAAGRGASKARPSEQARAAVRARWAKRAARNDSEEKLKMKGTI